MQRDTSASKPLTPVTGVRSADAPLLTAKQIKRCYRLGPYFARLTARLDSASLSDYLYVLAVFNEQSTQPFLLVTSEVNAQCWNIGGGSHFLCMSYGDVHSNLGASDDWANFEQFTSKALSIAASTLGVFESAQEILVASGDSDRGKRSTGPLSPGASRA